MAKDFESSVPETPRSGQSVGVYGVTDNENGGVVINVAPCPTCSAVAEVGDGMAAHEQWHAEQAGAAPK